MGWGLALGITYLWLSEMSIYTLLMPFIQLIS